ncbi:hypothetical protein [Paraburkholderia diazotrophica]|uniref:DUF2946 domain-containing protein n=1 Tax=Paraburkholderia diazotrophica TaxID=667676 RepID=A0A1H7C3U4_9BURK|nr:hypothetical protein [Paraburkholderia diazotrophica]SEJ84361.1 hypothetical protein SAMN05192539_102055 [Paraburkholderia diazotrophica]
MSYWRKLFIVVLLALSLPVQSFAAVSMKCGLGHSGEGMPSHHHLVQVGLDDSDHNVHTAASLEHTHPEGHHHGDAHHHAHSCSTCASCCFGVAMLSVPLIPASTEAVHFHTPSPLATPVASFLTGGIERPPRLILV